MQHIEREVQLPNPPVEVWEAVIDPGRLGEWLGGELEVSLRPGGRGSFRSPDGAARRLIVLHVDHRHELSFSWWPETDAGSASTVTITIDEHDAGGSTVRVHETRGASDARDGVRVTAHDDHIGAVFSALSDATRRSVLNQVSRAESVTATEVAETLPVSRQAVVKHLQVLGRAGLVTSARDGREVRYSFAAAPLADAAEWIAEEGANWDDRLERLRRSFDRA